MISTRAAYIAFDNPQAARDFFQRLFGMPPTST
jgi:hypothetical protein